jgi:hypothetical protein
MQALRVKNPLQLVIAAFTLTVLGSSAWAVAAKVQHHHDGAKLVSAKLHQDGHHDIDHKGKYTASVDVKGGKIAALHVNHADKGAIPVKKYKTHQKMVQTYRDHLMYASFRVAQLEDMGTEEIGYSYVDDQGNEEIYWFPAEEIYDADTGAIEYVPLNS